MFASMIFNLEVVLVIVVLVVAPVVRAVDVVSALAVLPVDIEEVRLVVLSAFT